MSDTEIKVPNIGEFKDVEVIEVLVSNGQSVSKNDPLITIESDKSSVEIPSSFEGKVKSVNIKVGDKVSEGDTILIFENTEIIKEDVQDQPKTDEEKLKSKIKKETIVKDVQKKDYIKRNISEVSAASPKVRKFARELGVDVNQINGSQRQGRVVESDVKSFISSKINKATEVKEDQQKKIKNEFSHSDFGEVEVKEMPRVKKLASTYLVNSWTTIPHVTNHDELDITEMDEFRKSLTDMYTGDKKKITPLAFIVKALASSLKKFPSFNSSIDELKLGNFFKDETKALTINASGVIFFFSPVYISVREFLNSSISVMSTSS